VYGIKGKAREEKKCRRKPEMKQRKKKKNYKRRVRQSWNNCRTDERVHKRKVTEMKDGKIERKRRKVYKIK
jgi:hypothetical protein